MSNIKNFKIEDGYLQKYSGRGGEVEIPESVQIIGSGAFRGCSSITKISVPASVTVIADRAFADCTALSAVSIPETIKEIGLEIFTGCTAMADKNGLVIIDDCLYGYIGSRSSLVVPEGVTQICRSAFRANEKIKSIQLPASLKKIHDCAFEDCRKLQDVSFPEGMINKKTQRRSG